MLRQEEVQKYGSHGHVSRHASRYGWVVVVDSVFAGAAVLLAMLIFHHAFFDAIAYTTKICIEHIAVASVR